MTHDFTAFLRSLGLRPGTTLPDGRVRRCATESHPRRRNGAYWLSIDGRVGFGQDWAQHAEPVLWRSDGGADREQDAREAAALLREARAAQAEQRRRQAAATARAREIYAGCAPLIGAHPYLEAKGLDMRGCRGLRVDADGWLVVPMHRGGELVSLQRISPRGEKRFWKGAPTRGASYTIERQGATLTVLCEGLATGLALYAAVPHSRVVVAFNAGNLPRVAESLPRRGMVAVAADNDHATEQRTGSNPGVEYARAAAELLGCGVAVPEDLEGTDWLDWRTERLAVRLRPVYGRRTPTEAQARRAVDAGIASEVMRAARYVTAGVA